MAAQDRPPGNSLPNDDVGAVSDEALQKAEAFIEADEGAANRLMGWAGRISTTIAVVMSLFHLYAAYAIVPTQELRYTHVAFTLVLSFLLFPLATRFRNRVRWWDVVPGIFAVATIVYALWGGDDFTDRATSPDRWDVIVGVVFIVLRAGGDAAHHRADHACGGGAVHRLCDARPASAGAVDASRLRPAPAGRPSLHYPGGHFRRRGRRVGDPDHPVHDLRRVPGSNPAPASSSSISRWR